MFPVYTRDLTGRSIVVQDVSTFALLRFSDEGGNTYLLNMQSNTLDIDYGDSYISFSVSGNTLVFGAPTSDAYNNLTSIYMV